MRFCNRRDNMRKEIPGDDTKPPAKRRSVPRDLDDLMATDPGRRQEVQEPTTDHDLLLQVAAHGQHRSSREHNTDPTSAERLLLAGHSARHWNVAMATAQPPPPPPQQHEFLAPVHIAVGRGMIDVQSAELVVVAARVRLAREAAANAYARNLLSLAAAHALPHETTAPPQLGHETDFHPHTASTQQQPSAVNPFNSVPEVARLPVAAAAAQVPMTLTHAQLEAAILQTLISQHQQQKQPQQAAASISAPSLLTTTATATTFPATLTRAASAPAAAPSPHRSVWTAAAAAASDNHQGIAAEASLPHSMRRRTADMSLTSDRANLSEFQCLNREQICFFQADRDDLEANAQGRNKPLVLKQVGVLCKHCIDVPAAARTRGTAYFPAKLQGIYQACQNMSTHHFQNKCPNISQATRERIQNAKLQPHGRGAGKPYWEQAARVVGVVHGEDGLEFSKSTK